MHRPHHGIKTLERDREDDGVVFPMSCHIMAGTDVHAGLQHCGRPIKSHFFVHPSFRRRTMIEKGGTEGIHASVSLDLSRS